MKTFLLLQCQPFYLGEFSLSPYTQHMLKNLHRSTKETINQGRDLLNTWGIPLYLNILKYRYSVFMIPVDFSFASADLSFLIGAQWRRRRLRPTDWNTPLIRQNNTWG